MIAKNSLELFNFDLSISGCGGIDPHFGITYPSYEQALYEQTLKKHSKRFILLADNSKFFNSFLGKAFTVDECELYTNEVPVEFRNNSMIFEVKND